jgi:hypothetical protein
VKGYLHASRFRHVLVSLAQPSIQKLVRHGVCTSRQTMRRYVC